MKEVAISEFKAKCLSLIDEVQKTKKPICITRFGKPVAEVSPPSAKATDRFLAATAQVLNLTLVTADFNLLGLGEISTLANR